MHVIPLAEVVLKKPLGLVLEDGPQGQGQSTVLLVRFLESCDSNRHFAAGFGCGVADVLDSGSASAAADQIMCSCLQACPLVSPYGAELAVTVLLHSRCLLQVQATARGAE